MTGSDRQIQAAPLAISEEGKSSSPPSHSSLVDHQKRGEAAEDLQLVGDYSTADSLILIHTDKRRLNAFLTLKPQSNSAPLVPAVILNRILESNLVFVEDDLARLKELVATYCSSRTPVEKVVIARGLEPLQGEDGKIEWAIQYESKKVVDEDAQIDFRERETIRNVRKGDKLLTILPPGPGLPGRDVFGAEIAAPPGRLLRILRGANVRVEADGTVFYADADGRVTLERNLLRVDPIIEVKEDVDFSVGNIDFNGYVHVFGGVLDGFVVKAARGITIGGMVGTATLESDADIVIKGGMAGRGKGTIRCGGKLTAKYLNQLTAHVNGDILVSTEIHNCIINSLGNITVTRGSIIGGEITALGSISAPTIGSPMAIKTVVAAGVNFTIVSKLRELHAAISASESAVKKITERVAPFLQNKEQLASLPTAKLELIRNLLLELQTEQQTLKNLQAQEAELIAAEQSQQKKVIIVSRRLHAGVEIILGNCRMSISDDLDGPLKLTPNEADGTIRIRATDR